jgi:D-alanyl-D-alanine carboxypeptidase
MRFRRAPVATVLLVALVALVACSSGVSSRPSPAETLAAATAEAPTVSVPERGPAGPERLAGHAATRPSQPPLTAAYRPVLVPDACADRDLPAPSATDPVMTVLDRSYALPASYAPDDLVPASEAGFTGASAAKLVRAVLVGDLAELRAASEDAGLAIAIDSAYRSFAAQGATFSSWVTQLGLEAALARAARPGHSEHQLGTAIDLSSPGWSGRFGDWARETAEGAWMAEHAWEYGFVMSYPAGAEAETCFGYEPWHYRWIGRAAAAEHRAEEIPLRTFLAERAGG